MADGTGNDGEDGDNEQEDDMDNNDDRDNGVPTTDEAEDDDSSATEEQEDGDDEDDDDENEDEDMDNDESEEEDIMQQIHQFGFPSPYNSVMQEMMNHYADETLTLIEQLTKIKEEYESDKRQSAEGETKWEIWYDKYWPKSSYPKISTANIDNTEEVMADLLALETFRYELNDFNQHIELCWSQKQRDKAIDGFMKRHWSRLTYLMQHGIHSITKIHDHYRYVPNECNYILSWTAIVWLASCVKFSAQHITKELLTPFCIALLRQSLFCHEHLKQLTRGGRNRYHQHSSDGQAKYVGKILDTAVQIDYHHAKRRWNNVNGHNHHRSRGRPRYGLIKPRLDSYLIWTLRKESEEPIKHMRKLINSLNVALDQYQQQLMMEKENDMNTANMNGSGNTLRLQSVDSNRSQSVSSHISTNNTHLFTLPFPWDSSEHLNQFLFVCEKIARFEVNDKVRHHWVEKIIDGFFKNIINFPTVRTFW